MSKEKEQKRTESKKEAMIRALGATLGNVSEAIRKLSNEGISIGRTSHYRWLSDEDYKLAITHSKDDTLDLVETALINQIKNGSVQATTFYLKTKGRVRGYTERQEVDVTSGDEPISININI